jgi:tetratricopeptide (TPR) repeat protein
MSAKKAGTLLIALLSGATFVAAQNIPGASDVGREIRGIVRAAGSNQPIEGTIVALESSLGEIVQQATPEGSGTFTFGMLSRAVYYVSARAPGYKEMRQRADLMMARRISVQLFLLPLETKLPGSPPPGGAVDAKYFQIPEAARREYETASRLLKEKQPGESLEHFRKAISLHKDFAAAHMLLGTALMDLGRWAEAQPALERSLRLDDKQAAAFLALGACLAAQGKFAAAEKPLLRGLELNPTAAQGHLELGRVYWALDRWQDAEPHARKALELKSDLPLAHVLLGNILLRKRDGAGALAAFKEYLRLEPNGPLAPGTREVVGKLEKALAVPKG